jgi:hypothetical protein
MTMGFMKYTITFLLLSIVFLFSEVTFAQDTTEYSYIHQYVLGTDKQTIWHRVCPIPLGEAVDWTTCYSFMDPERLDVAIQDIASFVFHKEGVSYVRQSLLSTDSATLQERDCVVASGVVDDSTCMGDENGPWRTTLIASLNLPGLGSQTITSHIIFPFSVAGNEFLPVNNGFMQEYLLSDTTLWLRLCPMNDADGINEQACFGWFSESIDEIGIPENVTEYQDISLFAYMNAGAPTIVQSVLFENGSKMLNRSCVLNLDTASLDITSIAGLDSWYSCGDWAEDITISDFLLPNGSVLAGIHDIDVFIETTIEPLELCVKKILGDATCNDDIDLTDFNVWRTEMANPTQSSYAADFNGDEVTSLADFQIWRSNI